MNENPLLQEFEEFALESGSVLEGALLVARIIQPDTNLDWCRDRIGHLSKMMGDEVNALRIAHKLREAGFSGSEEYYKSENSCLEYVLRHRQGIPISLAAVILSICEQLQIKAHGVNFPSHFLVSIESTLIDPFNMQLLNEIDCMRWLKDNKMDGSKAFAPATTRDIVSRMLNNLGMLATANEDGARALEISDFKLVVSPEPFYIHLERIDHWLGLGVNNMARHEMELAIECAPDDATREKLKAGLSSIGEQPSSLH
jgi:regulator of sirC expression with transglutaminase-like and TPR domain